VRTAVLVAVGAFAVFVVVIAWALCRMARLADEWDEES
jgi:hypothetical protein